MENLIALDGNILLYIQEHIRTTWATPIMKAFSFLSDYGGLFWICLAITLVVIRHMRKVGVCCGFALLIMVLINNACIKLIVRRIRPYVAIKTLKILVSEPIDSSFPSGHSACSFAMATALTLSLPLVMETKKAHRIGIAFIIIALIVALSRIYVGVHYPTDIIGGSVLGILYGIIGVYIGKRFITRYSTFLRIPT